MVYSKYQPNTSLLEGNILYGLFSFAIPIFISKIFQQFYNTADALIVGNILGETSLAAIGSCSPLYNLLIGFALGVGNGLSIVIARCYGKNDIELIKMNVAHSIIIGTLLSLAITILSRITILPFLNLLSTPKEILYETYSYISTITMFTIVIFIYNMCSSMMRAIGKKYFSLVILVISSALNIFCDILFLKYFNGGLKATAYATGISQLFCVFLCLIYIKHSCKILIPSKENFRFKKDIYLELISQGLSMGFMSSIVSIGTVLLQKPINQLGFITIASHTTARKIYTFMIMPSSALSSALTTFVSQNRGADQKDRIKKAVKYSNILSIVLGIIISLFLFIYSKQLMKLISGSSDYYLIYLGSKYLCINSPFYIILGILFNMRQTLQGIGEKSPPLISSIIECIFKVIFVSLLIPKLGYSGVIICEPIIWCVMTIYLIWSFYHSKYMTTKLN